MQYKSVRFVPGSPKIEFLIEKNRKRSKQGSFTTLNLFLLMLKTILAAVSRVLLFSIWLYVFNNGQFSSVMTLIAYYTLVLMLIVFHTVCNKKKPVFSFPFCLGTT